MMAVKERRTEGLVAVSLVSLVTEPFESAAANNSVHYRLQTTVGKITSIFAPGTGADPTVYEGGTTASADPFLALTFPPKLLSLPINPPPGVCGAALGSS